LRHHLSDRIAAGTRPENPFTDQSGYSGGNSIGSIPIVVSGVPSITVEVQKLGIAATTDFFGCQAWK